MRSNAPTQARGPGNIDVRTIIITFGSGTTKGAVPMTAPLGSHQWPVAALIWASTLLKLKAPGVWLGG